MTVKELIDKLQQFDEDKFVLVEDTEYKEFQAIDVEPVDDRFVIITTTFSRYIDYKNTDKNFYDIKYNKMEYHKSIIGVIISIIASITIISILYFLQN